MSWAALVFLKPGAAASATFQLDTDNLISDRPLPRYGVNAESVTAGLAGAVRPCLERAVIKVERIPHGICLGFDSGSELYVCYEGETIDTLLKLTNTQTGEWRVD